MVWRDKPWKRRQSHHYWSGQQTMQAQKWFEKNKWKHHQISPGRIAEDLKSANLQPYTWRLELCAKIIKDSGLDGYRHYLRMMKGERYKSPPTKKISKWRQNFQKRLFKK